MAEEASLLMNAAVIRIGHRVGVNPDTLRGWVKRARVDGGEVPGVTTGDGARIKDLERELRELKRANEMALWTHQRAGRDVTGVIHHSDAGAQYVAIRYAERLADMGAIASIGTVGDSYDNALAETVVGLYKNECVKIDGPFRTIDQLEFATLSWVHWFNENRLHSSLRYLTPTEYEDLYYRENSPQQQPLLGETALH